jgi:endonuclease YncB( thermonuclease family)
VEPDKFGGRYLATVQTAEGVDVAGDLLRRGLAASYKGRGPKHNWCGGAQE